MKSKQFFTALVAGLGLAGLPGHYARAAESGTARVAPTGTVEGRVQNELTGRYLNRARIAVKGTNLLTLTDDSGSFRLANVPSGPVVIEVFYTGLATQEISLNVAAGQSIRSEVKMNPAGQEIVQLSRYEVESSRITDQDVIAVNEQRFAPNIKAVVATGELSEHADGNVGEFLKFMPGITGGAGTRAVESMSVRGFPSNLTIVTVDGGASANAELSGNSRTQSPSSTSFTADSIARIEVTKVPTPATGADTMAGSINLISRSAFEAVRAEFKYQVNFTGDDEHVSLKKMPVGLKSDRYYLRPSMSFAYTNPVSENFGFVITGIAQSRWTPQDIFTTGHNYNSATFGSSVTKPLTTAANYTMASGMNTKYTISFTTDWRVAPNAVFSSTFQTFTQENQNISYVMNHSTGTDARPTVAAGVSGSYGDDFTIGATGRGNARFSNNFADTARGGFRASTRYGFDNGDWKIGGNVGYSKARTWLRGPEKGIVNNIAVQESIPLRVELLDIDVLTGPRQIRVFNNANQEINTHDPSYHNFTTITQVTAVGRDVRDDVLTYSLDVKRNLDFLPFPTSVQIGGVRKIQERDRRATSDAYTYNGVNGDRSPKPYMWPIDPLRWDPYGVAAPVPSPYPLVTAWKANPSLMTQTVAQRGTSEQFRRTNSEFIKETADALYFQGEARLLNNRLLVLTGVRYEKTTDEGAGALNTPDEVFERNADGSFVLTAARARIRRAVAGATGSIEQIELTWHERKARSKRSYDDFYPSVHFTYNMTEKFLARAAYAKTYGRPDFTFIIPNTVINEFENSEGDVTGGRLTVRNPGLLPWTADNYDISIEYYTDQGGAFVAGVFRKQVSNFFGSVIRDATPQELSDAGVDPNAVDWTVSTTGNVGDARVDGLELSVNQSLSPLDHRLGGWGKSLRVFANLTRLNLQGNQSANFTGFLPTSINYGVQINRKLFGASIKANYRSNETSAAVAALGPEGRNYFRGRTHIDVNFNYNIRPNLGVFVNLRNIADRYNEIYKEGEGLPAYAKLVNIRNYGIPFNFGIKGSF
jgi:iron complex outermembrane receptor protein